MHTSLMIIIVIVIITTVIVTYIALFPQMSKCTVHTCGKIKL